MAIEVHSEVIDQVPVASATVMVVRDGPGGLEVLMVRRSGQAGVLGGAYVFPGGKLDESDGQVSPQWIDLSLQQCRERLGEDGATAEDAVGLHVAALRETFEECGLLLGLPGKDELVPLVQAATAAGQGFGDAVHALGSSLAVSSVVPWSRWITPRMASMTRKRFDTRFFVAAAPEGQEAVHDNHEATEAVWLTPRAAMERYWDGGMDMAPPQLMSLCELGAMDSVSQVMAFARGRLPIQIEPHPFDEDGCRVICYPGDPAHPQAQPVWKGPTRVTHRNRRFEPEGGLEALLSRTG
ncbi:NUDIX hydrolase [Hydrogenophaga sp. 5NK40-0174]